MQERASLSEILAHEIIEEPRAVAYPGELLSQVLSRFSRHGLQELPVVATKESDTELRGLLCLPLLLRSRRLPLSAKVENLLTHPPRLEPDLDLLQVCERLLVGDFRSLPVSDDLGHLKGLVSRQGVLKEALKLKRFARMQVREVMTPEPRSLLSSDSLSRARGLMRSLDVRTLPVVDQAGRLVGVVGQRELLAGSELSATSQASGDRSGNRDVLDLKVESLMRPEPVTVSHEQPLNEAVRLMVERNVSTLFVTDDGQLKGVLQTSDILTLLSPTDGERGVYIQLAGLDSQDGLLVEQIYTRLQHALQLVSNHFEPQTCDLHFSSEGSTSRAHFTVRIRLQTSKGLFSARGEGWSEVPALKEALAHLESQTRRSRK